MQLPIMKYKIFTYSKYVTVFEYEHQKYKVQLRSLYILCGVHKQDQECIEEFNKKHIIKPTYSNGVGNSAQICIDALLYLDGIEDYTKVELSKFHANITHAIKKRNGANDYICLGIRKGRRLKPSQRVAVWKRRTEFKEALELPVTVRSSKKGTLDDLVKKEVIGKKPTKSDKLIVACPEDSVAFSVIHKDLKVIREMAELYHNGVMAMFGKVESMTKENHEIVAKFLTLMNKDTEAGLAKLSNRFTKIEIKLGNLEAGRGSNNYNNELFTEVKKDMNTGFDQIWNKLDDISFPSSVWEAASKIEFLSLNKPVKKRRWYFLWLF